jgi:hypothetical protein
MEIQTTEVKKFLDDYDFVFESGMILPLTIDQSVGDKMHIDNDLVLIYLTAKPTASDPTVVLPAEDITIFKKHLVYVQHKQREVTSLTADQQNAWNRTVQELSKH